LCFTPPGCFTTTLPLLAGGDLEGGQNGAKSRINAYPNANGFETRLYARIYHKQEIILDYDFLYNVSDGIATITLNRPDVLNALTFAIYKQLRDLMENLRHDDDVKVVIITGAGKGFCSGGDVDDIIGELFARDMKGHLEFTRMTGALVQNMRLLDKPIIAAINGTAAGAGSVIALASDLRIASEKAKFAFLFTKVGLTGADMGAAYLLPRIVGQGRAMELLLLGDTIDAATADKFGLVNAVVPHDDLMPTVREWASRLATGPTLAISMTKRMVNNEWNMDLASAIEAEAQAQALMLMGQDHRAFYEAFKEKQTPRFTGR
jgi:enoyl-CoA hydratase/carnithine racemase